jgi:hypothetical protein
LEILHHHQNRILQRLFERLQKLRAVKLLEARLFLSLAKREQKQNTFSDKDNLRLHRQ